MAWIYEVRARHGDRVHSFGARRTKAEAEVLLADTRERAAHAAGHHDRYWIEEIPTEGLFEVPDVPTPRERFSARVAPAQSPREGTGTTIGVEIVESSRVVASYERNYAMLDTFEPFRQGTRDFALISPNYTATSVVDLATGQIVAREEPSLAGFCPVGFYVPDWWDVHDGGKLPGEMWWTIDDEWPSAGDFGFVWGCIWGDDSSWKVQHLDLSQIERGILRRDERFGYVELATPPGAPATDFIQCQSSEGRREVEFAVPQTYDLGTGERVDLDPLS
jgi:hypothetical protein